MAVNKKNLHTQNKDLKTVVIKALIGSVLEIVIFFVLLVIMSAAALKTDTSEENYKYFLLAAGGISGFSGGFAAVRPVRKKGLPIGLLTALPAYAVIMTVSFLTARSGTGLWGWLLLAVMMIFSGVGGIIAVNKRKYHLH